MQRSGKFYQTRIIKTGLILLLAGWSFLTACRQPPEEQPAQLNLPLTVREGYGPFYPGFGELTQEHTGDPFWGKIYLPVKNKPANWSNVVKYMVWLDSFQFVYQNFRSGNLTRQNYNELQESWKWQPDSTKLSRKPIKCYVYTLRGYDEKAGQWAVMIDTNNNLDFGDETAIYPEAIQPGTIPDHPEKPVIIQYEIYQHGKIKPASAPMTVRRMGDHFLYNFPQYALAIYKQASKTQEILVSGTHSRLNFEAASIVLPSAILRSGKIDPQQAVATDEVIELEGTKFRNKGVDFFNNVLQLERIDPTVRNYTLQTGQPFIPFAAKEFTSGNSLTLSQYKGKYVYIDFWATWCKGCVEDMPELKKTYQKLDKNRFAFLGVIANDKPERVRVFLREKGIQWPQIFSDSTDRITATYPIQGLPFTLLLGPDGTIIARNLRGQMLTEKLAELATH